MTTAVVHSPRSWLPALNLLLAGTALAFSASALVIVANDDPVGTSEPVVAVGGSRSSDYRCDLHAGRTRC